MLTDPQSEAAADAMSKDDSDSAPDVSDEVLEQVQQAEAAVAELPGSCDAHVKVLADTCRSVRWPAARAKVLSTARPGLAALSCLAWPGTTPATLLAR
jgi:hypothetical protein